MNKLSKYVIERTLRNVYISMLCLVLAIIHFSSKLIGLYPGAQGGTGGW